METNEVPKLVSLAFQYGPFFFAVLFCISITRWSYKIYDKACKEGSSHGSGERRKTIKWVFIVTFAFGILLVIVSIIWWLWFQGNQVHLFEGEICSLQEYERVYSDRIFFAQNWYPGEGGISIHNDRFLIRQNKPFKSGQKFIFMYTKKKPNETPQQLELIYQNELLNREFQIVFDEKRGRNVLKLYEDAASGMTWQMNAQPMGLLYAAEPVSSPFQEQALKSRFESKRFLADALQNEKTAVGYKINGLDKMLDMDESAFRETVETRTDKEPMIITLLDLSRHTDRELAFKAGKVIDSRFGLDQYLAGLIAGPTFQKDRILEIFLRMEQERAKRILDLVRDPQPTIQQRVAQLRAELGRGKNRVLIPTGAFDGDKYYMSIEWTGNIDCLQQFFKVNLETNPEIVVTKQAVRDGDSVLLYSNTKASALFVASSIEGCNAKVSFERILAVQLTRKKLR